jgi:cell division protein FtsB
MKWLLAGLLSVSVLIHYRLWLSEDGVREVVQLKQEVAKQVSENERLTERNAQLAAEVRDLKQGFAALEERARSDLGMIARDETYYQVTAEPAAGTQVPAANEPTGATRTAAR